MVIVTTDLLQFLFLFVIIHTICNCTKQSFGQYTIWLHVQFGTQYPLQLPTFWTEEVQFSALKPPPPGHHPSLPCSHHWKLIHYTNEEKGSKLILFFKTLKCHACTLLASWKAYTYTCPPQNQSWVSYSGTSRTTIKLCVAILCCSNVSSAFSITPA